MRRVPHAQRYYTTTRLLEPYVLGKEVDRGDG
jgi:hypothetical protein